MTLAQLRDRLTAARGEALLLRQEVARLEALHVILCAHRAQGDLDRDEAQEAAETYHAAWIDAQITADLKEQP